MANILVVDDHRDGREFLSTLLGYRGHHVLTAADGQEALRILRETPLDLVVSDILMPRVDGYELVRRMRADPDVAAMPVVFYTAGYEDEPARALASSVGVVQFLRKPSDPRVILGIIDAALGSEAPPSIAPPPSSFSDDHLELVTSTLARRVDELQREVVERRQAEDQVRSLNAALTLANERLRAEIREREAAQEQLLQVRKLEALGELTGGIAHDFNNLLTVVLGNLELAQKRNTEVRLVRLLDGCREAATRGSRLTQQLLAFARKQRLTLAALDLDAVVDGMGELIASTVGSGTRVETVREAGAWRAMGDRNQIEMVLLNLAANARDAMDGGGRIVIATAPMSFPAGACPGGLAPGDYVALSLADSGSGMTAEVLARAVEPFYTTKAVGKGTGLGLSMVHGVAKQSGGALAIASEAGRGTTMTVYLPRAQGEEAAQGGPSEALGAVASRGSVLVVDDDDAVRALAQEFLEELGYRVVLASCGTGALEQLARPEAVDLLMVDFAMPEMNGMEVARRVRAVRPDLPVLFVTGYASGLDLAGIDAARLLKKPFQMAELDAAVRGAMRIPA